MSSRWKTVSVFLSSTFADMHDERDYLKSHAFMLLESKLLEKHCYLRIMDLRGGAAERGENQRLEEKVFDVCLDGIESCRPRMIALLGDRYGWIQYGRENAEDMIAKSIAENVALKHQMTLENVYDKSVTHIEIFYALKTETFANFFAFFRKALPYETMDETSRAIFMQDKERQGLLKEEIRDLLEVDKEQHVFEYDAFWNVEAGRTQGLEALDSKVYSILKEDIFAELDKGQGPETDCAKRDIERYFQEKTIHTVKRHETGTMLDFVRNDEARYLLVYGEAGSGKSTLFAQFRQELAEDASISSENNLILTHIAGIDSNSCSIDAMLKKWNGEIKAKLGIVENQGKEIPEAENQFEKTKGSETSKNRFDEGIHGVKEDFSGLLTLASGQFQQILLLIDSVDSFYKSEETVYFTWLPEEFPANAKLIATTRPGFEIRKNGVKTLSISGLADARKAREMIDQLCIEKYGKEMPTGVRAELVRKAGTTGFLPLYLKIAASDLMRMTREDFRNAGTGYSAYADWMLERLAQMPDDIRGAYKYVFQRAQDEYGEAFVNFFIRYVAISKEGLRDSDLKRLYRNETGKDLVDVESLLVRAFLNDHLRQDYSGEYWAPEHDQFRIAVMDLMSEREKVFMHAQLAEHLFRLEMSDTLKKNTLVHHLYKADMAEKAACYLSEMPEANKKEAAAILAEIFIQESRADEWVGKVMECELPHEKKYALCDFMNSDVLNAIRPSWGLHWHGMILGYVCSQGEKIFKAHPENEKYAYGLSVSYERFGDYYKINGEYEQAQKYYEKSLEIRGILFGSHPESVPYARNLSIANDRMGDNYQVAGYPFSAGVRRQALKYYEKSLVIREKIYDEYPENEQYAQDLSVIYRKMWDYYQTEVEKLQALPFFEKYLTKFEQLYIDHPLNKILYADGLSELYEKYGNYYFSEGKEEKAFEFYRKTLGIREKLARENPDFPKFALSLSNAYVNFLDYFISNGENAKALEYYTKALEIREKLYNEHPGILKYAQELSNTYESFGTYCFTDKEKMQGLEYLRRSLAIREKLYQEYPDNLKYVEDLSYIFFFLGNYYRKEGDKMQTLQYYEKALEMREKLYKEHPEETSYKTNLSISYNKIGNYCESEGMAGQALNYFTKAFELNQQ